MDISNKIDTPVNMYAGNSINFVPSGENKIYGGNIFSSEFAQKEKTDVKKSKSAKKKKSRRLNTMDTDFLPNETEDASDTKENNFFNTPKINPQIEKLKKAADYIFTSIPAVNIFYLKNKERRIHQTVEKLSSIVQNADELLSSAVPSGEGRIVYENIAKNLTDAAIAIGEANKEF